MQDNVSFVANITGRIANDGSAIGVEVTTKDGAQSSFAFTPDDASKFITLIVGLAQEAGAKTASPISPSGPVTVHPIDVSALGVAHGRTDTEAILSVQFGPMSMMFAIELAVLIEQLERLRTMTSLREKHQPN